MTVTSRHTVEIDVRAPVGVGFGLRETGRLTIRAESSKSIEAAIDMLRRCADLIQAVTTEAEKAAA